MMKMNVKTTKKIAISLSLVLSGMFAVPQSAMAAIDFELRAWQVPFIAQYAAFVTEVDNQFFAINTYLAELYEYLGKGEGGNSKGLIGTIEKVAQAQRPYEEALGDKQSAWARRNLIDGINAQAILNKMPDPRACSELGPSTAGRGAAGGGSGGRAGAASSNSTVAAAAPGTKVSDAEHALDVNGNHGKTGNGFCSKQDARYEGDAKKAFGSQRGAYGCTEQGDMPNGDARIQSVFIPAHDYEKVAAGNMSEIAKASSLTYNPRQALAADLAIKNMTSSFSTPALPPSAESTPGGKLLIARQKILEDRISPAVLALSTIRGTLTPADINGSVNAAFLSNWKDTAGAIYARIFPPGTAVPDSPSIGEITRFEVFRRFFDVGDGDGSWVNKLNKEDAVGVARIQAETEAVQLYVSYEILNRIEQNNALQAAILAQLINPVSKQEITAAAQALYRSK